MTATTDLVVRRKGRWDITIPLPPVPASRPRVSRWGTYYLKTYATWKKSANEMLEPYAVPDLFLGLVNCSIEAIVKRPKKLTRRFPRPDVDNFAKAALDAITTARVVWNDDDQVTSLTVSKRYAEPDEEPCTKVRIEIRNP